jgi:hypothetical protein
VRPESGDGSWPQAVALIVLLALAITADVQY